EPETLMQMSDRVMEPALLCEFRFAKQFVQSLCFSFGFTNDINVLAAANGVEFVAHAADVAAEAFDRLNLQMACLVERTSRDRFGRDGRKFVELGQDGRDAMEILRPVEPLQVVLSFFLKLARLDQQ